MSKNNKQKKSKTTDAKVKQKSIIKDTSTEQTTSGILAKSTKPKRLIRAIAVTPEILEAAKAYKRATGISFYQLGHDTMSERLIKEGYLSSDKSPSELRKVEDAKPAAS